MVPVVPLAVVGRVGGVAVLLLLGDEGPLLIELDLAVSGGKRPPARRGGRGRARRPSGCSGRRCRGSTRQSRPVWRTPHPSATCSRTDSTFSGGSRESNRGVPLRSEKRALQVRQRSMRSRPSRAVAAGARSGFRPPACRGRGSRNSGSRSGRGRPWCGLGRGILKVERGLRPAREIHDVHRTATLLGHEEFPADDHYFSRTHQPVVIRSRPELGGLSWPAPRGSSARSTPRSRSGAPAGRSPPPSSSGP